MAPSVLYMLLAGVQRASSGATARAPFAVLWNSPWPACCGVKAEQELLPQADPLPRFVENNVTVNDGVDNWSCGNRSGTASIPCFNGHHVVTIYTEQTGLYPDFKQNATTKQYYPVNGGLPQLVNMTAHLAKWQFEIESMIPDENASPVVGLDWESWQPYWNGNNRRAMSEPDVDIFQNESIKLVRAQHATWSDGQVLAEAKKQWNAGAELFWTKTFELAKKLRPNALWSNYGVGNCFGCGDAEYYGWQKQAEDRGYRPKTYGKIALPVRQPAPVCPVPNDNDTPELSWLWTLVDVLEPVIYLSNQNSSCEYMRAATPSRSARHTFARTSYHAATELIVVWADAWLLPAVNERFIDCSLGEARRVATLARKLRGGKRMPIYGYAWYDWNAEFGTTPPSQFLDRAALDTIYLRAAMKHGIDGVFMWGGGFRDCAETWECRGNGTCTNGSCTARTSIGTFVNELMGPAAKRAVTAADACSATQCGGHGRCFDCPEPYDSPSSFTQCQCDCEDAYTGPRCAKSASEKL